MTILLILIACIKGIVLFLGIDKIARISQSKNYMMGALIASFAVGAYSQKSVHDYMGSPGIEGFFFTLILFAIVYINIKNLLTDVKSVGRLFFWGRLIIIINY